MQTNSDATYAFAALTALALLPAAIFLTRWLLTAERCPKCRSLRVKPFSTFRRCHHCHVIWNAHRPAPPLFRII